MEVTATTSHSAIPVKVDIEMSVTNEPKLAPSGSFSSPALSKSSIPIDVRLSVVTGDQQEAHVDMDISDSSAIDIDVQVAVSSNRNISTNAGNVSPHSSSDAGVHGSSNGYATDVSQSCSQTSIESPLPYCSLSDSTKQEINQRAQVCL